MKIKRAKSLTQIGKLNYEKLTLNERLTALIGEPSVCGSWIIYGNSGNGKTRLAMQILKEISKQRKVLYYSLEEGEGVTFKKAIQETGIKMDNRNINIVIDESFEEMKERMKKRECPKVVIVDSLQYSGIDKAQFKELITANKKKLFIFISHAEGNLPLGSTAKSIMYFSDVKIHVKHYVAYSISRYGGGEDYIIWNEGAEKHKQKQ